MDNRPVLVRTTISANDFWARERSDEQVNPENGRVLPLRADTPYGRQVLVPARSTSPPIPRPPRRRRFDGVGESREVERAVMRTALEELDSNTATFAARIDKLEATNALLKEQLHAALKINSALAAMLKNS